MVSLNKKSRKISTEIFEGNSGEIKNKIIYRIFVKQSTPWKSNGRKNPGVWRKFLENEWKFI